jgi:hypothetical protein
MMGRPVTESESIHFLHTRAHQGWIVSIVRKSGEPERDAGLAHREKEQAAVGRETRLEIPCSVGQGIRLEAIEFTR